MCTIWGQFPNYCIGLILRTYVIHINLFDLLLTYCFFFFYFYFILFFLIFDGMAQELENVILEQNLVFHNYADFAAFNKIDEGSVGIVYKSMWNNKLMVALKCL